jgi:hypothetical protein
VAVGDGGLGWEEQQGQLCCKSQLYTFDGSWENRVPQNSEKIGVQEKKKNRKMLFEGNGPMKLMELAPR